MDACEGWTRELSEYVDGDLDDARAAAVEAHLDGCASCRAELVEVRALAELARGLGGVPPARDLWPGVARAIGARAVWPALPSHTSRGEAGGVTGAGVGRAGAVEGATPGGGIRVSVPQLAAAAAVIALVSASLTLALRPAAAGPDRSAAGDRDARGVGVHVAEGVGEPPASMAGDLATIEDVLVLARDRLDPVTAHVLEESLVTIERAIEDSRRALRADPGNTFVREHLERAYRTKLSWLREAASLVEWAR